jgi:hypothetical protein
MGSTACVAASNFCANRRFCSLTGSYGGRLTEEFLELETKIDNFASKTEQTSDHRRVGKHAGLEDELADIEARVAHLQEEAAAEMKNANAVIDATET